MNIIVLTIYFIYVYNVMANDYDDDEKLFMMVSPDQHQRTPRLEDFFWTGSGDGPPAPEAEVSVPSKPSTPLVRTTTVLATVYLDSYPPQAVTDKTTGDCVMNCGEPVIPDSLEPEIPEDRRYWLLTVIQGSTPDSLHMRLARLYQKAFLRQQERHLGIIKSLDAPTARKKHDVHSFIVHKENNKISENGTPFKYFGVNSTVSSVKSMSVVPTTKIVDQNSSSLTPKFYEAIEMYPLNNIDTVIRIEPTKIDEADWILATPTITLNKREISDHNELEVIKEDLIDIPLESEANETILFKREIIHPDQQPPVRVHIQNITESPDSGTIQIVYVVLVGGRAVPAAVAARDMRLVRDAEVARELGAVVTTKAEPAYLKAAEGLEGEADAGGVRGSELWALAVGSTIALLLVLILLALLCFAHRKKQIKSAASLRAYRDELMREAERKQLKQVHEERDGKLISVVSPSRTRPSSSLLPIYRAASASSSSTTSSGVSEVAAALRRRQKKPHALRMPQKRRVGTTDSLLEAAGVESSDSGQPSAPPTPTSYLSMPSVSSFPRGNIVEPLSKILEPVSVRHLDIDSPISTPKKREPSNQEVVPRRQMPSQLVRLGSIDKDPGVIGPLVWDLHCQRIKDVSKPSSPTRPSPRREAGASKMRQRFNELMDDAFTLFGSAAPSPAPRDSASIDMDNDHKRSVVSGVTQAHNHDVRLPGSDTGRGHSAGTGRVSGSVLSMECLRPRTTAARPQQRRAPPPASAWGPTTSIGASVPVVNPGLVATDGRLPPEDPAVPLISAIKTEIQRIRDNATKL
ncbi:uncharacterized protein LOC114252696 isoform X1 [Bombyx mandarina]|uniref:Uncharacterized protein LOC114252696 isoform X1 n=1 Tax=Bombyx mandarina TaxID=7092 RepID=A0A6J2KL82_BOMMA|nr:uncharacterized protein LOC114252696 isoform X1 [Bombyx mandarina]